MKAREPADGEQRRLGEREDAREKRGADDLGDDEHLQAEQAVPAILIPFKLLAFWLIARE